MSHLPNIVIIMTDQQRADLAAREGFALDTTPFLDSLARQGADFARAYTSMPVCAPARVSLFTGRYPSATAVRTNHNLADVRYDTDLLDVLKSLGYATALCGKNHSHRRGEEFDYNYSISHGGGSGTDASRTAREAEFDAFLAGLHHMTHREPTPFPLDCQGPYRCVSRAQRWIDSAGDRPFFLWLSFAEPHNPFQVPEPYFSMFPPESLPPTRSGPSDIARKSFKYQWTQRMWRRIIGDHDAAIARTRANYMGMLRLIDDQVKRFVTFLDERRLRDNTILIFMSDHGDFAGEYGLIRKGPELPEVLCRIPLIVTGPGIVARADRMGAHVSIADIMPTLCEAIGQDLPPGVQGRSLWPMLTGGDWPEQEFDSAYCEHGYGGLYVTDRDPLTPEAEGAVNDGCSFDCLNTWTQCGAMRMIRKGDWKLLYDMLGSGQLYNLADDPAELNNRFGDPAVAAVQSELLGDLLAWALRAQDPLPPPRRRYHFKRHPRNYTRGQ